MMKFGYAEVELLSVQYQANGMASEVQAQAQHHYQAGTPETYLDEDVESYAKGLFTLHKSYPGTQVTYGNMLPYMHCLRKEVTYEKGVEDYQSIMEQAYPIKVGLPLMKTE